jgi:hypothetical protein
MLTRCPKRNGIYRGEVYEIMGTLSDIVTDTRQILAILRGYDAEDDEEEDDS